MNIYSKFLTFYFLKHIYYNYNQLYSRKRSRRQKKGQQWEGEGKEVQREIKEQWEGEGREGEEMKEGR